MVNLLVLCISFILGAEAGASFSWSKKWQGKYLQQLPEILFAAILGGFAMYSYSLLGMDLPLYLDALAFASVSVLSYAGIQSATWMFLQWEGHNNPTTTRDSSTKPIVDRLTALFGWGLGDEGYSWTAAVVKGTIVTLPLGGLGGILFALGYEIGSHAHGRVDKWFNPHIVAEGLSFVGITIYALIFLEVCKLLS